MSEPVQWKVIIICYSDVGLVWKCKTHNKLYFMDHFEKLDIIWIQKVGKVKQAFSQTLIRTKCKFVREIVAYNQIFGY